MIAAGSPKELEITPEATKEGINSLSLPLSTICQGTSVRLGQRKISMQTDCLRPWNIGSLSSLEVLVLNFLSFTYTVRCHVGSSGASLQ